MNRRGFLGAILAAGIAPAIVRVESLMVARNRIVLASMPPPFVGLLELLEANNKILRDMALAGTERIASPPLVMTATEVQMRQAEAIRRFAKAIRVSMPPDNGWFKLDA